MNRWVDQGDTGHMLVQILAIIHTNNELHVKEYEVHLSHYLLYCSACNVIFHALYFIDNGDPVIP